MQNQHVKKSHIIPHFYLKNFLYEDEKHPKSESVQIAYRENFNDWKQCGINKKGVFTFNGIYDFNVIKEDEQTVEKQLSYYESNMANVTQKIKNKALLDEMEFYYLAEFIISMMNRTVKKMTVWQNFIKKIYSIFMSFDNSENHKYSDICFYGREDFSKFQILATDDFVNSSNFIKNSFYFLYNKTEIPFISSDNPVILEDIKKNEIKKILCLPVENTSSIERKSFIFPLTPNICIFYCDYLDKSKITDSQIEIKNTNVVFKLNLLQLRNCEKFVFSNIMKHGIDYKKAYIDWCNINHSDKLVFETDKNRYVLTAEIKETKIFDMIVRVYDKSLMKEIIANEKLKRIYKKDEFESFRPTKYEIEEYKSFILLKATLF